MDKFDESLEEPQQIYPDAFDLLDSDFEEEMVEILDHQPKFTSSLEPYRPITSPISPVHESVSLTSEYPLVDDWLTEYFEDSGNGDSASKPLHNSPEYSILENWDIMDPKWTEMMCDL